jgi:hypothetical protein
VARKHQPRLRRLGAITLVMAAVFAPSIFPRPVAAASPSTGSRTVVAPSLTPGIR